MILQSGKVPIARCAVCGEPGAIWTAWKDGDRVKICAPCWRKSVAQEIEEMKQLIPGGGS